MSQQAPTFLHIDLPSQSDSPVSFEELTSGVGGLGWALPLFEKFREEDPIIVALGPLSSIFPGASRAIAVYKSPQTGGLATSVGGGSLPRFLRFAGYQGFIITGSSKSPVFISVSEEGVSFKDANHFSGLTSFKLFDRISSEEGVPSKRAVLAHGAAAERGFSFSPLYIDEFFSFGRGGLGRVFASKRLRGLSISGTKSEDIKNPRRYEEVFSKILKKLEGYSELSQHGTLKNLEVEKKISGVPFKNLKETGLPEDALLAQNFEESLTTKKVSSSGCPVGDVRLFRFEDSFIPYNYESVVSLGPLLGLTSPEEVAPLLARAFELGFDPVSLGVILAYVTEKEGLQFSDSSSYITLIDALYTGKEEWAKDFKRGLPFADEALVLGGMEFLPYFNGYASLLSQIFRFGFTTEENRGYLIDIDLLESEVEPQRLVEEIVLAEERKTLSDLLVGNGHLASVFEDKATAFSALEALGLRFSHEELVSTSSQVFQHKLKLQSLLGFKPSGAKISERFFEVPSPHGLLDKDKVKEAVEIYGEKVFEASSRS